MSEEIKIYFDEDGIAKEYDDTYDITIHCESEEEQNELLDRLNRQWIPVSERLPEESLNSVIGWDAYRERCIFVQFIDGHFQITGKNETFDIQAWMPLPEPYKASPTGAESEVQDADSD